MVLCFECGAAMLGWKGCSCWHERFSASEPFREQLSYCSRVSDTGGQWTPPPAPKHKIIQLEDCWTIKTVWSGWDWAKQIRSDLYMFLLRHWIRVICFIFIVLQHCCHVWTCVSLLWFNVKLNLIVTLACCMFTFLLRWSSNKSEGWTRSSAPPFESSLQQQMFRKTRICSHEPCGSADWRRSLVVWPFVGFCFVVHLEPLPI